MTFSLMNLSDLHLQTSISQWDFNYLLNLNLPKEPQMCLNHQRKRFPGQMLIPGNTLEI